jgi:hypothetical protein
MRNCNGPKRLKLDLSAGMALCLPTHVAASGRAAAEDTSPEILSNWGTGNAGYSIHRDCGYNMSLPNKSTQDLTPLCHAILYEESTFNEIILGADAAAEGPYTAGQAPQSLGELPTPLRTSPCSAWV